MIEEELRNILLTIDSKKAVLEDLKNVLVEFWPEITKQEKEHLCICISINTLYKLPDRIFRQLYGEKER